MDRIRAEFKSDSESSAERSEIYSGGSLNSAAGTHTGQGSPHQRESPHNAPTPHVHIGTPPLKGASSTGNVERTRT